MTVRTSFKSLEEEVFSVARSVKPSIAPQVFFCRIFSKRERWGLSRRGWLIVFALLSSGTSIILLSAHPFLAVTHRVDAEVLVVEGWVHEYAIRYGAEEFKTG